MASAQSSQGQGGQAKSPVQSIEKAFQVEKGSDLVWYGFSGYGICTTALVLILWHAVRTPSFILPFLCLSPVIVVSAAVLSLKAWTRKLLPPSANSLQRSTADSEDGPTTTATRGSAPPATLTSTLTSAVTSQRTYELFLGYLTAGTVNWLVYKWAVSTYSEESAQVNFFAPTPRHPWHLQEGAIFIVCSILAFAALQAVKGSFDRQFVLGSQPSNTSGPLTGMRTLVYNLSLIAPLSTVGFGVPPILFRLWPLLVVRYVGIWVYLAVRKGVFRLILRVPIVATFVRPFIVNFVRPSHGLNPAVGQSLTEILIMTLVCTDMLAVMALPYYEALPDIRRVFALSCHGVKMDEWFTQGLKTQNQWVLRSILAGLDSYLKQDESSALINLFSQDPPRRPDQARILDIWQGLLLQLGKRHSRLLALTPATSAPPAPAATRPSSIPVRQAAIRTDVNVLLPPVACKPTTLTGKSVKWFQDFLAGGQPVAAQPVAAAKVEEQLAGYGERVGAYLSGLAGQAVEGAKEKLLHAIRGTGSHAVALVMWPSDAVAGTKVFCGEEWAKGEVEQGLRQAEMLQATLEPLVTITEASIQHDRYGYIQSVIPATMELILRHMNELGAFEGRLVARSAALGKRDIAKAAQSCISEEVHKAISACQSAVCRLAEAYGTSFRHFNFPPTVQAQLQQILDKRRDMEDAAAARAEEQAEERKRQEREEEEKRKKLEQAAQAGQAEQTVEAGQLEQQQQQQQHEMVQTPARSE